MQTVLHWIVLVGLLLCCHGNEESMHHLVLLDQLPHQFNLGSSPQIIVRTNFSVSNHVAYAIYKNPLFAVIRLSTKIRHTIPKKFL